MTQSISRKNLKELYNLPAVCEGYKTKIEAYLKKDLFADSIDILQDDIEKALQDANEGQRKVIRKYFKGDKIVTEIKTWKDVLKKLKITEKSLNLIVSPKTKEEKARNAFTKLLCITKVYNNGWTPDWSNTSQYKYYIYLSLSGGSGVLGCYCSRYSVYPTSGLYFQNREKAIDSSVKFKDVYDDYFMI